MAPAGSPSIGAAYGNSVGRLADARLDCANPRLVEFLDLILLAIVYR